jgi:hypothetical protein
MNRREFLLASAATLLLTESSQAQVTPPEWNFDLFPFGRRGVPKGKGFLEAKRSSFGWVVHGQKLYILGGHFGPFHDYPAEAFSDQLLEYDLVRRHWRELRPYPFPIQGLTITADGDFLYAFGGFRYSAAFDYSPNWKSSERVHWSARSEDLAFRYDIARNRWYPIESLPHRRSSNALIQERAKDISACWVGRD